MGMKLMDDEKERQVAANYNISTPKHLTLSHSKLGRLLINPPYSKDQMQMQTPPLLPSVSIPFRWEEAPGKPRATTPPSSKTKTSAARRCLDLPPRLQLLQNENDHENENEHEHEEANANANANGIANAMMMMPDDGPYVGRSLSLACTFSFRKGAVGPAPASAPAPGKSSSRYNLGSGRWGSFRNKYYCPSASATRDQHQDSFDFSHSSLGDFFKHEDIINNNHNHNSKKNSKKMTLRSAVKRKTSFFSFSTINSSKYLLGDIYASIKQAVPWRRT